MRLVWARLAPGRQCREQIGKTMSGEWLETLREHCTREWESSGSAVMLSRVPSILSAAGVDLDGVLQGRKLRPFLETEAADTFKVIQSEQHKIVWGIVPAGVDVSAPYDRYFRVSGSSRPTRFAPAAWRAFTLPIALGRRRWLYDEPTVRFEDLDSASAPPAAFEVENRFVVRVEDDSEVDTALVLAKIAEWAAELKVDPSRFALGRRKSPAPRPQRSIAAFGTALDQLLGLFIPSELARVSLPLDVISRLNSLRSGSEN